MSLLRSNSKLIRVGGKLMRVADVVIPEEEPTPGTPNFVVDCVLKFEDSSWDSGTGISATWGSWAVKYVEDFASTYNPTIKQYAIRYTSGYDNLDYEEELILQESVNGYDYIQSNDPSISKVLEFGIFYDMTKSDMMIKARYGGIAPQYLNSDTFDITLGHYE